MILAYLSVVAFLFGAGSCSYDVQKSPDEIFYFHVAKLRTRAGKINVTEIVGLLKNGSEVAGKVQGVFEKVQKLKDGPVNVNDLMEVGKEVYDVGKQVYDVGKQAFEVGKNVFEASKDFLDKHQGLLQVGKTMGKTLQSISKHIGPALGGIGIAFALITVFMPKEDSAELVAIKNGFKEMHQRFDQVSSQIAMLESKIDFYQAIAPYKQVRDNLAVVYRDYLNLAEMPTSAAYKKAFNDSCTNKNIEPLQALEKLRRIVVNPGPEDQPHMIKSIITQHKLDYKTIMGWFERLTQNAYTLAMVRSACFGALHGQDDSGREHSLNQTETWVKEIVAELAKYEEKFTSVDEDFVHVLEGELKNLPTSYSGEAERELNERCDKWEKELTGNPGVCRGDQPVNARRVAVNNFLNTKYYWLNWLVVVYQGPETDTDNPCDTKPGTHWLHIKAGDQRVFVSWARRDALEATQLRQKALSVMDDRLREFKPDQADTWDTYYGQYGKYFIVFNVKMHEHINNWIKTVSYPNKTKCSFGGYTGTYFRSVVTAGVGAYRAQSAYRYIVDYVVIFW